MTSKVLKMLVFDLDFTLWPFWVDTHVSPPFKKNASDVVVDSYDSVVEYYPEVPEILKQLHYEGYTLGVASRTSETEGAKQLLQLFGWDKYFSYLEIFPGRKTTHFSNLQKQSGINFEEMIFFDDELRNIHDVSDLGVVSVFVKKGVDKNVIKEGKQQFEAGVKKSIK